MADECMACPVEVRALYAAAHNAVGAIDRALQGHGDRARAIRKLYELKEEVERFKPIVERHFAQCRDGQLLASKQLKVEDVRQLEKP